MGGWVGCGGAGRGMGDDTYEVDDASDVSDRNCQCGLRIRSIPSSPGTRLAPTSRISITLGTTTIDFTGNRQCGSTTLIIGLEGRQITLDGALPARRRSEGFGVGNDTYAVDNVGDVVHRESPIGVPTRSFATVTIYTLGANVEKSLLMQQLDRQLHGYRQWARPLWHRLTARLTGRRRRRRCSRRLCRE